MDKPLIFLTGHSHWIRTAKYNPYHDQLILSGGSDAMVNLWRIASCSSAPWLGGGDGDNDPPNVKVKAMDQHEESIYGVAWSPADAWIYCSLSFDGRLVSINFDSSIDDHGISSAGQSSTTSPRQKSTRFFCKYGPDYGVL